MCIYYTLPHCPYAIDDTQARDKLARMARRSVLATRRHWMRPTGLARFRAGCPHAPLRSHRDRHSIAHRAWAPRARTFTTSRAGAGALPSAELQQHDVAQPLSDRSIRKSPSFLQTLFAAQSHGVLSVASASVRDCGRACVSRRCAFARGASRGSSPQVRASTRIIHRRGAPALSQALSRRRRRDGQPERASFDRDR